MRFRASARFTRHTLYTQRRPWHPLGIAGLVAALVGFLGSAPSLRADDPLLKQLFDRQAAAAVEQAKSPHQAPTAPVGSHILVLADGRVIDGAIRGDLHGYRVETPEASMFFSFDQVQLVARDRHEAYEKMCATEPTTTPVRRDIRLGRWCLENRLPREAAFHLRKVLEFDPSNQEAKALLTRLEAAHTAPGGFVKVSGVTEHAAADAKLVESLARLSPDRVKEFVIGVQPILLARCGNVRCHGGPTNTSFHLDRVHLAAGGNRQITGRNLDAVLQLVDPQYARRSLLLAKAAEAHGGATHPPLAGGASDVQKARLLAWLSSVGPELNRMNREDSARRSVEKIAQAGRPETHRDPLVVPASAAFPTSNTVPVAKSGPALNNVPPNASGVDTSMILPAAALPRAAAGSSASKPTGNSGSGNSSNDLGPLTDPFDPAQFNRGK
jgi:hypothetical protein